MAREGELPVGTKVTLSQQGIDLWHGLAGQYALSNPTGIVGTVLEPNVYWEEEGSKFVNRVVWSNGTYNWYFAGDLDVVVN